MNPNLANVLVPAHVHINSEGYISNWVSLVNIQYKYTEWKSVYFMTACYLQHVNKGYYFSSNNSFTIYINQWVLSVEKGKDRV